MIEQTDEQKRSRTIDHLAERLAANRKRMNPSLDKSKVGQPRPDNVGLIVGNFIYNNGARK